MIKITVEELEIIVSAKIEQVKPQIQKVVNEIKNAVKNTDGLGSELIGKVDADRVKTEIAKAKQQVDKIFNSGTTAQEKYLQYKINELKSLISTANRPQDAIKFQPEEILKWEMELEKLENKLQKLQNKKIKIDTSDIKKQLTPLKAELDKFKKYKINIGDRQLNFSPLIVQVKRAKQKIESIVENTWNKLKNGVKSIDLGAIKGKNTFSGLEKSAKKVSSHLKVGLGQILKIAGSLVGIRTIYNGLRNVASSWLSSQNEQAQQLQANLNYMKYALGSSLEPVIQTIFNLIYEALKGVQSLIYALTGVNIFANASAKAYSNMASSAKKAKKETQALADIDEIHNIQENTDTDGTGSGNTSPNFDLSELGTSSDLLSSLIENIKNGNWYEIGESIGNKINEALEKIPWEKIKEKASKCGKNLAEFLNGGIKTTNWNLVGGTLAEGCNTAIRFLHSFIKEFNWKELGKSASECINGFFDKVEWNTVGQTLSDGLLGALDFMIGVIETFDTNKVYEALWKITKNIKWLDLLDKLEELIEKGAKNGIFGSLTEALTKAIFGDNKKAEGISEILLEGALPSSKEMEAVGSSIIGGLSGGIIKAKPVATETWSKVKSWFTDIVKTAKVSIPQKWSDIKDAWNNLTSNIKDKVANMKAQIATKWDNIKNTWNSTTQNIKDKIANMKAKVGTSWDNIKNSWNNATKNIRDKTASMKAKVATAWSNIKNSWNNTTKNIKDKTVSMKAKVATTWSQLSWSWNSLISHFKDKTINITAKISPIIDKVKSWLNTNFIDKVNKHIPNWIGQIPRLAGGGVLFDKTLVEVAEYTGARTNPEIISPQNIMYDTMRKALNDTNANENSSLTLTNQILLNGKVLAQQMLDDLNNEAKRRGYKPILQRG